MMRGLNLLQKAGGLSSPALKIKCLKKRFFFREDDVLCYRLDSQIDYMLSNGIAEMNLWLAKKENNTPYFFCRHFGEVGEKSEGGCGNFCEGYEPKNGKSGVCKNYGNTYEKSDICFTINLNQ